MITPERTDAPLRPRIPCTGSKVERVQSCINLIIRELAGHLANNFDRLETGKTAVFTRRILLHSKFGMPTACPVNHQNDLSGCFVHVSNDLLNQNATDALLSAHLSCCSVPNGGKIVRQAG